MTHHINANLKCDQCGELIIQNTDALVEWIEDEKGVPEGIRIVHLPGISTINPNSGCFKYTLHPHRQDLHLEDVLLSEVLRKKLGIVISL
jgi:hypothetical protein